MCACHILYALKCRRIRSCDASAVNTKAGTTHFPRGTKITLEVDTSVHTAARGYSCSAANAVCVGGAVEPLALEVCLFDNGPSSSSCLLGRGTLPLTTVVVRGHPDAHQERQTTDPGRRKKQNTPITNAVALVEPATGKTMASVALGLMFLHHRQVPDTRRRSSLPVPVDEERDVAVSNANEPSPTV